jgi:transcriptional regulator with XRE-family HTH domain
MPLNNRDTLTPFRLPPDARLWEEFKPKVAEYNKLVRDRSAAQHRLDQIARDRRKAEQLDQATLAAAIREGKPDPGNAAVKKLEQDEQETNRLIGALEEAIFDVEAELVEVFDATKDEQHPGVDAEIDAASLHLQMVIEALQDARWKLAEAVSMKRFLKTFPDEGDWRPGEWPLHKLVSPSGDAYDIGKVIEALKFDIDVAHGAQAKGPIYLGGAPKDMGTAIAIVGDKPEEPYYPSNEELYRSDPNFYKRR